MIKKIYIESKNTEPDDPNDDEGNKNKERESWNP